jgi:hypothetical protein
MLVDHLDVVLRRGEADRNTQGHVEQRFLVAVVIHFTLR